MGLRLFRRIKIAPGISINLSKSGLSASAGVRGAHVTLGPRGVRRTVGIASGGRGIWGRWATYAQTGHGGNKKLRGLLRQRGPEHAKNFLYTILETAPVTATVQYLAVREQHWMLVLGSKANGLNS